MFFGDPTVARQGGLRRSVAEHWPSGREVGIGRLLLVVVLPPPLLLLRLLVLICGDADDDNVRAFFEVSMISGARCG